MVNFAQTIAHRVVDKVDESLKGDIMHWAAFYVRSQPIVPTCQLNSSNIMFNVILNRRFECA